jgi:uncharacterized membrane-anchored protein
MREACPKPANDLAAALLLVVAATLVAPAVYGQQGASAFSNVRWTYGPTTKQLGEEASIKVPDGYVFADGDNTRTFMETIGNPATDMEVGCLAPDHLQWFLVFEFNPVGFVSDDEKDSLDEDALLESIIKSTEKSNKVRERRGITPIEVQGWHTTPQYNSQTHNLEWAIKAMSDGESLINHNTRILGRNGVMEVTFVGEHYDLSTKLNAAKRALNGFHYTQGNRYEEYVQGDKIAKYGLGALIAGGTAAVALKSGLLRWLWKIIVVAVIGVGAFFKKLFGRG